LELAVELAPVLVGDVECLGFHMEIRPLDALVVYEAREHVLIALVLVGLGGNFPRLR